MTVTCKQTKRIVKTVMFFSKKECSPDMKKKINKGNKKELYHKLTNLKINCQKINFMLSNENKTNTYNQL